jgi:hypothetical protein
MNDLYLGAYWGPRQESIGQCADRLAAFLEGLCDCDDAFAQWYEKGKSRKSALRKPFNFRANKNVLNILESGRHCRDLDRSVMDDLGFHVGLWNGGTETHSVSISISCGLYCPNPHLRNSVVITLPEDLGGLADKDRCVRVLKIVADTWEPDWAGVISKASRNARAFNPAMPFVDWMFYINRIGIDRAKLPTAATASEIEGKGTVVIVQDRPIDPANEGDLANANAVATMFGITG